MAAESVNFRIALDRPGAAASRRADHMNQFAGGPIFYIMQMGATRDTAYSGPPDVLRPQVRKASLSPIAHGILPPRNAGDDGAGVSYDDLKFIPAIVDHEEAVSG